jgi:hypothetical protein
LKSFATLATNHYRKFGMPKAMQYGNFRSHASFIALTTTPIG